MFHNDDLSILEKRQYRDFSMTQTNSMEDDRGSGLILFILVNKKRNRSC